MIGAVLGALAGGAIGEYMSQRDRTAQQAAQATNYQPTQGIVLQIDNANATPRPSRARPGDAERELHAAFAQRGPDVRRRREHHRERPEREQGGRDRRPRVDQNRQAGSYTSQVPLILPAGAAKGTYQVLFSISLPSGVPVQRTAAFTVN